MGDATNMVLILSGELLKKSEHLLIMGLHPSEIIKGYELACTKALAELESTCIILAYVTIISRPIDTSTIDVAFTVSPYPFNARRGPEACDCIKTIRLRGYTFEARGGSCFSGNAE